jgi:Zn-dependent protease
MPMDRRVGLGRAFGVEISVDWTWIFAFVLTAWTIITVGTHALPDLHPAALTFASVAAATGLFASLAVHELAHGLAARAWGVPVRRVTLFLFGGITDVERAPASPRSEVLAASVALLTNAALGIVFLGVAAALGVPPARFTGPSLFALWLGGANLAIAMLNLLPAFPLDGGRILRAGIWRTTNDVERATRWAAWVGQVIGWSTVLGGVALGFAGRGMVVALGIWTAFVGWFLASAAAQAYQGVVVQVEAAPQVDRSDRFGVRRIAV